MNNLKENISIRKIRGNDVDYNTENEFLYKHEYDDGVIGICKWNMDRNEMVIKEKITGYLLNSITNLIDFIKYIVYEKDRMLALHDIKKYINGNNLLYQSTFRIMTNDGEIKWVLFKGEIERANAQADRIFTIYMLDVTSDKMWARHDSLTNLINKRLLEEKLENLIKIDSKQNKQGALLYIDIEDFTVLNSKYGYYFGNLVLKRFSQILSNLLGKNSELARMDGARFAILLYHFDERKEIEKLCDEIHNRLKIPFEVTDKKIYISVNIGVSVFPKDSSNIDELITFSELAVKKSKQNEKKACAFFDNKMLESYVREIMIKSELETSILNNELYLCYQPQINALNNELFGVEALLRWNNKKLGNVSPAEFIPIAEKNGYIDQIGDWVLENALKAACLWMDKGYKFRTIAVNVSQKQLKRSGFKDYVLKTCAFYHVPYEALELEITESALLNNMNVEILNELLEAGVNIAIDDFGTGYSSLSYLIDLPVNTIKIDKIFIDNLNNDRNKALISSVVELSKHLDYKVITEGAETIEQVEALIDLGCNFIQGYYFSRPLPENEFEHFLIQQI